jgi:hypothetical protein
MAPVYILLCAVILLMTLGRVVWRPASKGIDWALEVAFIRLDFPPAQRIIAQQLAAGLAEIVGMKIKQLKPEHNLSQIAEWADDGIYAKDLITLFVVAFNVSATRTLLSETWLRRSQAKKSRAANRPHASSRCGMLSNLPERQRMALFS